jgi:hypothetical protein
MTAEQTRAPDRRKSRLPVTQALCVDNKETKNGLVIICIIY